MTVGEIRAIINDPLLDDNSELVVLAGERNPRQEKTTGAHVSLGRTKRVLCIEFEQPVWKVTRTETFTTVDIEE